MKKGLVFDIDRFATHDGPGIRAAVFLKGCPLACKWCHSPESQKNEPETIFRAALCAGCIKCTECAELCPAQALRVCGTYYDANEIVQMLSRDKPFYLTSGGGITLTGGEPLMQWEFVYEILSLCRQEGIHTAIETSGFGNSDSLLKIAGLCDLIYYDIKSSASRSGDELHKKYTGVSNALIWENLSVLCKSAEGDKIVVRIPCIPDVNDSLGQITEIVQKLKQLGIKNLELMPYNAYADAKYEWLNREYELANIKPREQTYYDELTIMAEEILRGQ